LSCFGGVFLGFSHLSDDVLSEVLLLYLNHFTAHRAEIEEREDVDFENLEV